MRIAVISDTHNQTNSVRAALKEMADRGVERILHCGDIQNAETVRLFPAHTHFVFGNCDFDRTAIDEAVRAIGGTLHGVWGEMNIDGLALAFTHGDNPTLLCDLEQADAFDFLFHGHTHIAKEHQVGITRVINPGALQRVARRTFLILDLPSGETETVEV